MEPFVSDLDFNTGRLSPFERSFVRYASDMIGYYHKDLEGDNPLIYECFEREVPSESGHIIQNTTILNPGEIDGEYFMTKGHYHANPKCSEVYLCLRGSGYLLMQTKVGEWDIKEVAPGKTIYVPPDWAHRSINVGNEPLIFYALFPADSGHDYATIAANNFKRRVVMDQNRKPVIVAC
jgi:glucose-6-phosphate isomerase, archaeal